MSGFISYFGVSCKTKIDSLSGVCSQTSDKNTSLIQRYIIRNTSNCMMLFFQILLRHIILVIIIITFQGWQSDCFCDENARDALRSFFRLEHQSGPNSVVEGEGKVIETGILADTVKRAFGQSCNVYFCSASLIHLLQTNVFLKNCIELIQSDILRSKNTMTSADQRIYETVLKTECRRISTNLKICIRSNYRGSAQQYFEEKYTNEKDVIKYFLGTSLLLDSSEIPRLYDRNYHTDVIEGLMACAFDGQTEVLDKSLIVECCDKVMCVMLLPLRELLSEEQIAPIKNGQSNQCKNWALSL
ncbi:hypothetical protein RF11_15966 [Thelohanellus kitauei]|uniref:Uncharacterized protein n=1 Tax=Thelohanellus kitauei TaxID=669202 RepID=A0A0C2MY01_THEKT|nr:hypothetical protein RF11_15966 [Thelohanellus kitauei]